MFSWSFFLIFCVSYPQRFWRYLYHAFWNFFLHRAFDTQISWYVVDGISLCLWFWFHQFQFHRSIPTCRANDNISKIRTIEILKCAFKLIFLKTYLNVQKQSKSRLSQHSHYLSGHLKISTCFSEHSGLVITFLRFVAYRLVLLPLGFQSRLLNFFLNIQLIFLSFHKNLDYLHCNVWMIDSYHLILFQMYVILVKEYAKLFWYHSELIVLRTEICISSF